MHIFKRICLLIFCLILASFPAAADEAAVQSPTRVATEYNDGNLYDNYDSGADRAVPAAASALSVDATSAILMEPATQTVLFEQNADAVHSPASITKIMTMLLVAEALDAGVLTEQDPVTASEHANSMGGSQIWLETGEVMTVHELLLAVAVASANDASVALAEHLCGSEEAFVARMNERAAELGCTNTHFVNACGLDAEGHQSTARDIALMACALLSHPVIRSYTTVWMDSLRGGKTQLVNTNKLVRFYEGATGLKTGTTDQAGFCLAASAERNGMQLVAVILDAKTSDARFSDAKTLLNFGFAGYAIVAPDLSELTLDPIPVDHGTQLQVEAVAEAPSSYLLARGQGAEITQSVSLPEAVQAPVRKNQMLGKIIFSLDGSVLGECRLLAAQDVPEQTFSTALSKLLSAVLSL